MALCMFTGCVLLEGEGVPVYKVRGGTAYQAGVADPDIVNVYTNVCADCGRRFVHSYMSQIMDTGVYVCNECVHTDRYAWCQNCGNYYTDGNIHRDNEGTRICDHCFNSNGWETCADCGNFVHGENISWRNGVAYCATCKPLNFIHNYHYKPYPKFHTAPEETTRFFMGVELEVDGAENMEKRNACSVELHDKIDPTETRLYQKHDGSLNGTGIELVTHPCTLEYMMTTYPWDEIIETCLKYGYKSNDTSTCGLHVHVSRDAFGFAQETQDLNIAKVLLLFDHFWEQIVAFSRRRYEALERWAKKAPDKYYSDENDADVTKKMKNYQDEGDRYTAVNLCNDNTVEFRVFKGTLRKNTIMATLQFLYNLVNFVTSKSLIEVQNASWLEVAQYQHFDELDEYLTIRNLDTDVPQIKVLRPRVKVCVIKPDQHPFVDGAINQNALTITTESVSEDDVINNSIIGITHNGVLEDVLISVGIERNGDRWNIHGNNMHRVLTNDEITILDWENCRELWSDVNYWAVIDSKIYHARGCWNHGYYIGMLDDGRYVTSEDTRGMSRRELEGRMVHLTDDVVASMHLDTNVAMISGMLSCEVVVIAVYNGCATNRYIEPADIEDIIPMEQSLDTIKELRKQFNAYDDIYIEERVIREMARL